MKRTVLRFWGVLALTSSLAPGAGCGGMPRPSASQGKAEVVLAGCPEYGLDQALIRQAALELRVSLPAELATCLRGLKLVQQGTCATVRQLKVERGGGRVMFVHQFDGLEGVFGIYGTVAIELVGDGDPVRFEDVLANTRSSYPEPQCVLVSDDPQVEAADCTVLSVTAEQLESLCLLTS